MALLYLAAGINHFWHPAMYMRIMPPYLPWHLPLVYLSGICEILFALLLLPVRTRCPAAWLIIAMLIAIFPANIQMTLDYCRSHSPSTWLTIVRLPLQFVLIAWAWRFAKKPSTTSSF
jgi:uncharacterized membrane protein